MDRVTGHHGDKASPTKTAVVSACCECAVYVKAQLVVQLELMVVPQDMIAYTHLGKHFRKAIQWRLGKNTVLDCLYVGQQLANLGIVKQIYFPRIYFPVRVSISGQYICLTMPKLAGCCSTYNLSSTVFLLTCM